MKKQNRKHRKLRKCERGVKTKSLMQRGFRSRLTSKGFKPIIESWGME